MNRYALNRMIGRNVSCCSSILPMVQSIYARSLSQSTVSREQQVFDRSMKKRQRNMAAIQTDSEEFDYLRQHVAQKLIGRVEDIRKDFPIGLDIGSHAGHIYKEIGQEEGLNGTGGIGGIQTLYQCDMAEKALLRDVNKYESKYVKTHRILADEEFLPFGPQSFDIVFSSMNLHWINDLPQAFQEIREVLKPDGVFLGAMLGGSTLNELRTCLLLAEQEREGGVSPHISPQTQISDVGSLLQGAGFSLPTVDVDTVQLQYPDAFCLMEHLQGMGDSNAIINRRNYVSRDTLIAAASIYQELFPGEDDGTIQATFQIIYMIGWSPHSSQQKPDKRGSATKNLKKELVTKTIGEKDKGK